MLPLYVFNIRSEIKISTNCILIGVDIATINTTQGALFWKRELMPNKSCTSCHTNDLKKNGAYATRTKKLIKSMSPKINQKRLTDTKKNKWLKRNYKFS